MFSNNAYSKCKRGKREDIGDYFFRSAWEANYARYLTILKETNQIINWEFEPITFFFEGEKRGAISYLPDFRITKLDNSIEYHEVKGWMDAKSKSKLKKFAKYYPKEHLVLIDSKQYNKIKKEYKTQIPLWED